MSKLEELAKDCIENHTHRLVDKPTKQFNIKQNLVADLFLQTFQKIIKEIEK